MRYLAIGDIHGYSDVLSRLLRLVDVKPEDWIITLGDYVDRGPDSRGVLDQLIALHRRGRLIALRGNHDTMMLEARNDPELLEEWIHCGGNATLASYSSAVLGESLMEVPREHWAFLEDDCLDWYEIDTHFFVHANADPDLALEEQPLYLLHWEPLFDARPHCSGKIMICGHTKQRSGLPRNLGHTICIDTWVYGEGWLTCLDVATGKIWQANRRGEERIGWLTDPREETPL